MYRSQTHVHALRGVFIILMNLNNSSPSSLPSGSWQRHPRSISSTSCAMDCINVLVSLIPLHTASEKVALSLVVLDDLGTREYNSFVVLVWLIFAKTCPSSSCGPQRRWPIGSPLAYKDNVAWGAPNCNPKFVK